MIQSIEVWNFEAHEHSVVDDLSAGLNGVFGDSDVGKTSLVRALKLAAYNEFDPASVRVGAKNCRVKVTSERGYVDVTRGKQNEWEVCHNGGSPKYFSKIGKKPLPEAQEVLGLRMVELGDQSLPVNIMDQGENHFMLNELGGSDASGSMRAQVVDEISGLSGIEGLINAVSLDRHRFGRQVKEAEDKAAEIRDSMHDKEALASEEKLLAEAQSLVAQSTEHGQTMEAIGELFEQHHVASGQLEEAAVELKQLPNTKRLRAILREATDVLNRRKALEKLQSEYIKAQADMQEATQALQQMPDLDEVRNNLQSCRVVVERAVEALRQAEALGDAMADSDEAENELQACQAELDQAKHEHVEALRDIELCPLTGKPVSDWCFEGIDMEHEA